jgi:spore germination cell wall hydrolase CwlJ-like protein
VKILAVVTALSFFEPRLDPVEIDEALCLAEIVQYEANNQGWVGKQAVANVALVRAEPNNHFPDSICGVLEYPNAFSHRAKGIDITNIDLSAPDDYASYKETLKVVLTAMEGDLPDNTQGADHFFDPDHGTPEWAHNPISQIDILNHRFVQLYP